MTNLDNNLPNVNRHNPYDGWDRGLFLTTHNDVATIGKIDKMTYITYGGINATGILTYTVRVYDAPVTSAESLETTPYQLLGPFKTIIRMGLYGAIVPESMAIHAYKNNKLDLSPTQISEVVSQGTRLIVSATKGSVKSIQTTLEFECIDGVLTKGVASIEFKVVNTQGKTRVVYFTKEGDVDPVTDTLMYIKKRLDKTD